MTFSLGGIQKLCSPIIFNDFEINWPIGNLDLLKSDLLQS